MRACCSEGAAFEYDHLGDWSDPVLQLCVVLDQHRRGNVIRHVEHSVDALVRDFALGLCGYLTFECSDARLFALLFCVSEHPEMSLVEFELLARNIWAMGLALVENPRAPPIDLLDLPPL